MRQLAAVAICSVCVLSSGCATMVNGSRQNLTITSDPPGADILVADELVGKTPFTGEIRRRNGLDVQLRSGDVTYAVEIKPKVSKWIFGDVVFLSSSVYAGAVDFAGGAWNYADGAYHVRFPGADASMTQRYVYATWDGLSKESAQGGGPAIDALSSMSGRTPAEISTIIQKHLDDAVNGKFAAGLELSSSAAK